MSVMSQDEYIAILFANNGYNTAAQRRGWLELRFSKKFPDELTTQQKSEAIAALKDEQESR